jgi:hypothetical protein
VQNALVCVLHAARLVRFGTADCARATPNDTAVAAMISEIASASVAINSTPVVRFLDNDFSETGDAKPTFPVSAVMMVWSFANQKCFVARTSHRTWAKPLTNKGDSVFFG